MSFAKKHRYSSRTIGMSQRMLAEKDGKQYCFFKRHYMRVSDIVGSIRVLYADGAMSEGDLKIIIDSLNEIYWSSKFGSNHSSHIRRNKNSA